MDYSKEKFPLSNVVLYSKGWYKQSGDLIKDVISMLKLDGYPCANGYFDAISIVSKEYNDWNEWKHKNDMDYKDINSFIKVFLNKYSLDLFMHKRSKFLDMMLQVILDDFGDATPNETIYFSKPTYDKGHKCPLSY